MSRIAFFSHFDIHNQVDPYVIYLLDALKKHVDEIIVISHSDLDAENQNRLSHSCSKIIIRENKGYDFGAWKAGMLAYGLNRLKQFDEVILLNDSCYGPLDSFDNLFATMEKKACDFWGIADNGYPGGKKRHQYHLQSFFLCFKKNVFTSPAFNDFFINKKEAQTLNKAVYNYEAPVTNYFKKHGFQPDVFAPQPSLNITVTQPDPNATIFNPIPLLKQGMPLVKRKLFEAAKPEIRQAALRFISEKNATLTTMIQGHIHRVLAPADQLASLPKMFVTSGHTDNNQPTGQSIAIQLHVFYVDLLDECSHYISHMTEPFDLLITATSDKDHAIIKAHFEKHSHPLVKETVIKTIPNRGRNISALLIPFKNRLQQYDVVCHFYTKKSPHFYASDLRRHYILDNLLGSLNTASAILRKFYHDKKTGVLFPPSWGLKADRLNDPWGVNRKHYLAFCHQHQFKNLPKQDSEFPVAPYGGMFWFTPKALQPLFDLDLDYTDFEAEPCYSNSPLRHILTQLLVPMVVSTGHHFYYTFHAQELAYSYINLERHIATLKTKDLVTVLLKKLPSYIPVRWPTLAKIIKPLYRVVRKSRRLLLTSD